MEIVGEVLRTINGLFYYFKTIGQIIITVVIVAFFIILAVVLGEWIKNRKIKNAERLLGNQEDDIEEDDNELQKNLCEYMEFDEGGGDE